ncbi:AAA family ATPase [Actinophytocola sp.]|uniref:AAA family ATPase n=1 Tax=Actinophytocola sp. TaxID=1872138 RepID=UPI002D7E6ED7|nr:AAA family ATPase [Actinophytocola sp.]HET9138887.1 AAA family ATPase [Actinophytocola sp.]
MTALEELTRVFENATVSSAIIESLLDHDLEIRSRTITAVRHGYTGARLAKAELAYVKGKPKPRWCVIKFCPPGPAHHRREGEQHVAALRQSPEKFRQRHLTEIVFPEIRCPPDALVIVQSMADGDPLGTVGLDQLAGTCKVIWDKIFKGWACRNFDSKHSTLAELLESELGHSFRTGGWLRDWARRRGLLEPAWLDLPDEVAPLPNPWRLFADDSPATQKEVHYLVGRTHGDLHGDNVLVPVRDGTVHPADFRLIDLATYHEKAPLSRDLATLLVSLCCGEIGASSSYSRSTFLAYLERDYRDARLDGGMLGDVREVIDALREPALRFVQKNWDSALWNQQLKVSLLAQAMLHTAYTSGTPDARRWCSRLAGRLTGVLLGPVDPQAGQPMPFDAGKVIGAIGTTAAPTTPRPVPDGTVFVDRTGQRNHLRVVLEDQFTSVIVVSGPPGIGKTALVREVLADLGWPDPDVESSAVRWHDATPYGEIGVPTLIEDIEPAGSDRVAGPSARARLEIALDALDTAGSLRPVIVIDSAENLLDEGHVLRDSELDLALEAVHGRMRALVKVVLVTQHPPQTAMGVSWPGTACSIRLDGLEPPSLHEHFAVLDPANRYGLAGLADRELWDIHRLLAGNPRLAELLHAVRSCDPPGLQAWEVGPWLSSVASEVHQRLVHRFVDHLPAEQQLVAKGLAALGIPVPTNAVIAVLEPYLPGARIEPALRALVAARLVLERRDGRRYLRKTEIGAVLGHSGRDRHAGEGQSPTRRDLVLGAAKVLARMKKDDDDIHGMVDLDMHFARVDAWLRAEMYERAHSVIEDLDDLVRIWGSGAELRAQRIAVRGKLGDDREGEMVNLAGLADIYSYSGDFRSALDTYRAALNIAKEEQYRTAMRQIYIGMGSMFWEYDRLADAEQHYGWALALAAEDDGDDGDDDDDDDDDDDLQGDRAAALIGVADCQQRRGHYGPAVTAAHDAFEAAREADPGLALDAALRLARWYAELDQLPNAQAMLTRCEELIPAHPAPSARAELLISTADLYLYRDQYRDARGEAEHGVGVARDHRDPINLRRGLTTLALIHVHLEDLPAAHKTIEESARYRVAGRETVELALRAIIAHRCGLRATARDLFRQLHHEASERTRADSNDLPAWDFTGIARCHSVLLGESEPATALEAFRRARPETAEPTPGLDDRLRFMVETLADGDPRLAPVLTELARFRLGRSG